MINFNLKSLQNVFSFINCKIFLIGHIKMKIKPFETFIHIAKLLHRYKK